MLPAATRSLLVAKVRIIGHIFYRGGQHPWDPPQPRPNTALGAEVEILDIVSGNAEKGTRCIVSFIARDSGPQHKYPHTPPAYARDYYIVSYVDGDNERQLIGLPESQETYERWNQERWEYERERDRPGARDR